MYLKWSFIINFLWGSQISPSARRLLMNSRRPINDMNFPLITSIFCSSVELLQSVFRASSGSFSFALAFLSLQSFQNLPKFSKILQKSSRSSLYLLAVVVPVGLAFKSVCYYISSFCFSVKLEREVWGCINSSPSSLHFGGAREFEIEWEKDRKELKKTKIMKIRLLPYHQTTFPAWFFQIWSPYLWDFIRREMGKC